MAVTDNGNMNDVLLRRSAAGSGESAFIFVKHCGKKWYNCYMRAICNFVEQFLLNQWFCITTIHAIQFQFHCFIYFLFSFFFNVIDMVSDMFFSKKENVNNMQFMWLMCMYAEMYSERKNHKRNIQGHVVFRKMTTTELLTPILKYKYRNPMAKS